MTRPTGPHGRVQPYPRTRCPHSALLGGQIFATAAMALTTLALTTLGLSVIGCTVIGFDTPYNKGVEAFQRGHYNEAAEQFKMAIEKDPNFYEAHYNLARSYDELAQSYELEAKDAADAPTERALNQQSAEMKRKAEAEYKTARELNPKAARVLVSYAMFVWDRGNKDQAKQLLVEAAAAETDRAYPLTALGYFHQKLGNRAEAKTCYDQALLREPNDAMTLYRLGTWYEEQDGGGETQAKEKYSAATRADPADDQAWLRLARLCGKMGAPKEAVAAYQQYLRLISLRGAPGQQQCAVLIEMARLQMQARDFKEAVRLLWSARELSVNNLDVSRLLEQALAELHREEVTRLFNRGEAVPGDRAVNAGGLGNGTSAVASSGTPDAGNSPAAGDNRGPSRAPK